MMQIRPEAMTEDSEGQAWHPKDYPLAYGTVMNYAMKLGLPSEPYLQSIMVSGLPVPVSVLRLLSAFYILCLLLQLLLLLPFTTQQSPNVQDTTATSCESC